MKQIMKSFVWFTVFLILDILMWLWFFSYKVSCVWYNLFCWGFGAWEKLTIFSFCIIFAIGGIIKLIQVLREV